MTNYIQLYTFRLVVWVGEKDFDPLPMNLSPSLFPIERLEPPVWGHLVRLVPSSMPPSAARCAPSPRCHRRSISGAGGRMGVLLFVFLVGCLCVFVYFCGFVCIFVCFCVCVCFFWGVCVCFCVLAAWVFGDSVWRVVSLVSLWQWLWLPLRSPLRSAILEGFLCYCY